MVQHSRAHKESVEQSIREEKEKVGKEGTESPGYVAPGSSPAYFAPGSREEGEVLSQEDDVVEIEDEVTVGERSKSSVGSTKSQIKLGEPSTRRTSEGSLLGSSSRSRSLRGMSKSSRHRSRSQSRSRSRDHSRNRSRSRSKDRRRNQSRDRRGTLSRHRSRSSRRSRSSSPTRSMSPSSRTRYYSKRNGLEMNHDRQQDWSGRESYERTRREKLERQR